jgi:hypothetical protein
VRLLRESERLSLQSTGKFKRDLHANKIRTMAHEKKQLSILFYTMFEAGSSQNTRRLLWD